MTALNTTPIRDLRAAISDLQSLAITIAYTVSLAEYANPGSEYRDDHAAAALEELEQLEQVIRDARTGIEALP